MRHLVLTQHQSNAHTKYTHTHTKQSLASQCSPSLVAQCELNLAFIHYSNETTTTTCLLPIGSTTRSPGLFANPPHRNQNPHLSSPKNPTSHVGPQYYGASASPHAVWCDERCGGGLPSPACMNSENLRFPRRHPHRPRPNKPRASRMRMTRTIYNVGEVRAFVMLS